MSKPSPQAGIDPITLARFLVMPGIEPLLDAFGRIPPGPMRDSVIHLARTLADQYDAAPPEHAMPDPLLSAAGYVVTPPPAQAGRAALAGPTPTQNGRGQRGQEAELPPALKGPEAEVIRLRKKGVHPQAIHEELGVPRAHVDKIISSAKAAGIVFKNLRTNDMKGPLEKKPWHTSLDQLRGQGLSRVEAAAAARGISPQEYFQRRLTAVDMAMKGAQYPDICKAVKESMKTVSLFLSNARAAGIPVPYSDWTQERIAAGPEATAQQADAFLARVEQREAEQAAREAAAPAQAPQARPTPEKPLAPPPEAAMGQSNVIRPARFFGPFAALTARGSQAMIARAAARRGMTPDAYLDLQESIVQQRLKGVNPSTICTNTGQDAVFVKDAIQEGKKRGAAYPPCPKGWSARATG